ncbi:hypothetical protein [Burkholderia cepacia]|uniref:hypothetical protein n=1 Tax=Burkholderia cepacia TaxID=292 RepID=UPI002AB7A85E|nr:hypothetical protein [Burkholderia cepacia]
MKRLDRHQSEGELRVECTIVRYNVKAIIGWLLLAAGTAGALFLIGCGHPALAAIATLLAALGAGLISQSRGPLRRVQRFECGTIRITREAEMPIEGDQR